MTKYDVTKERINNAINEANLTSQDLAERTGLSKSSISLYRNGKAVPNSLSAEKLAKILNVSPAWLMGFDVPMKDEDTFYINHKAEEYARFLYEKPEYKTLFDASMKVSKKDLEMVAEMLRRFSND